MDFRKRVDEAAVAKILHYISDPPNVRKTPNANDENGQFDFWFDGGAARIITGHTEYAFDDGTKASVLVTPILSVTIDFPNGSSVAVQQTE
jgi:hypothetical protein